MRVILPHQRRIKSLNPTAPGHDAFTHLNQPADQANERYQLFKAAMDAHIRDRDFNGLTREINDYRQFAKSLERQNPTILGSKSKYYSSILEELPALLFEQRTRQWLAEHEIDSENFVMGAAECRIGAVMSPDCQLHAEKKCIDFCFGYATPEGIIPLVAFEVKKYLDKTMFGTVLETYTALKAFRPKTVYGFIVEDEARSSEVALNSKIHDAEFILSGASRDRGDLNPFKPEIVRNMDESIERMIKQNIFFFQQAQKLRLEGKRRAPLLSP